MLTVWSLEISYGWSEMLLKSGSGCEEDGGVAWADGRVAWAVASKTKWFGVQVPVIGFEG